MDFVQYYENIPARELSPKRHRPDGNISLLIMENTPKASTSSQKNNKKAKKGKSQAKTDCKLLQDTIQVLPDNSSTPLSKSTNIKPIIKHTSLSVEKDFITIPSPRKKRNKSVSFMLDDKDETIAKKVKSYEAVETSKYENKKYFRKVMKNSKKEKENLSHVETPIQGDTSDSNKKIKKNKLKRTNGVRRVEENDTQSMNAANKHTDSYKNNRNKDVSNKEKVDNESKTKVQSGSKKSKKTISTPNDGSIKNEIGLEPGVISEDLENLSIGDNAHTLTHLLDEMKVVDKNKIKKNKKKSKIVKKGYKEEKPDDDKKEETEKIKWKKRKWNKDRKLVTGDKDLLKTVVIDGLPLHCIVEYKQLLQEHLKDCGHIHNIGVAEVYFPDVGKPVFSTTVTFDNEEAVNKALHAAESSFEGNNISLWRPLTATQTTVAVRSYAELAVHTLSSTFCSVGKIRNIHPLLKGKKTINTAFIEFDGPKAVERAIKFAQDEKLRIGGKKVHVSKFEPKKNKKEETTEKNEDEQNSDSSSD